MLLRGVNPGEELFVSYLDVGPLGSQFDSRRYNPKAACMSLARGRRLTASLNQALHEGDRAKARLLVSSSAVKRAEIVSDLLRQSSRTAPDLLASDVGAALAGAGADHLVLYVIDYDQAQLVPVGFGIDLASDGGRAVPVEGTMAGRAWQTQRVLSASTEDGPRVWAPLVQRAERLGVLEAGFSTLDDDAVALCADLGHLVGHLLSTADHYTDAIEVRRRRKDMSLAAEMQWDMLLPPLAFRCPDLEVAGRLEPAYEVGGDAFDYSLNGDVLSFAFLDAMGHSVHSTMASALVLAAYRHARRRRLSLVETARFIDDALSAQLGGEVFVTGHLGQLEVPTGEITWVNAGHPDALVARGGKVRAELHAPPWCPLGLGLGLAPPGVGRFRLEPEDRVLFYSDGVVDARPAGGEQWGTERLRTRFEVHLADDMSASETLRRIIAEVCAHRVAPLADDASLLLIQWQTAHREDAQRAGLSPS
jgi:hypothetical protein